MPTDALQPSGAAWWPDHSTVDNANLTRFMQALRVNSLEALNQHASADLAGFQGARICFLNDRFERPCDQMLGLREGLPFAHWCVGGTANVVPMGAPDTVSRTAVACTCVPRPGLETGSAVQALSAAVVAGSGGAVCPAKAVWVNDLPRTRNMKRMCRVVPSGWQKTPATWARWSTRNPCTPSKPLWPRKARRDALDAIPPFLQAGTCPAFHKYAPGDTP